MGVDGSSNVPVVSKHSMISIETSDRVYLPRIIQNRPTYGKSTA